MLRQIDASNKDLSKCMDQLERNGCMSSTPLTSPTLHHRSSSVAAPQPVLPHSVTQDTVPRAIVSSQRESTAPRVPTQPLVQNAAARDTVVPGIDVLRSIPSISSAITQLLASYDQQAVQDALPGKS